MNSWDRIREYLRQKISAESFDNWLKGTIFLRMDKGVLFVSVPDRETRAWLETEEYSALVRGAIRELNLPLLGVSYEAEPKKACLIRLQQRWDQSLKARWNRERRR